MRVCAFCGETLGIRLYNYRVYLNQQILLNDPPKMVHRSTKARKELLEQETELAREQNRAKELDIEILRQKNISEGKVKPDLDLDSPEANQQEKIALFEEFIKQMAENGSMFGADIAKDFQAKLKELE